MLEVCLRQQLLHFGGFVCRLLTLLIGVLASRENGTRTPDPSQRLLKPRLVGISDESPRANSKGSERAISLSQLKVIGHTTSSSKAGLSLSNIPKYDDYERPRSRGAEDRLTPLTPNFSLPRRRSSAFIDILDAQGELKPYDFRSRVQASGSRDYGEDVADRNIQPAVAGSTLLHGSPGSAPTGSYSRQVYAVPAIPDCYVGSFSPKSEPTDRPGSRQASLGRRPRSRGRLSPAVESFDRARDLSGHDVYNYRLQSKSSYGQISVTGSPASKPPQAPRTADGRYMRDEDSSFPSDLSASPPGIPRYKPRQYSLPSSRILASPAPGSVRSARETLNQSLLPPLWDRSRQLYQQRCKTPTSPNQLHSFRHRVENDWSRFNRYAGEHLQPTVPHWDDAASSPSEYAPSFTFGSTGNLQLENTDRQPSVRTFGKRGSVSSFAHSDYSSHQFPGSRSVCTADTSIDIDIPTTSLFNNMSFGGGSSRNLPSRGSVSCIAPDFTGKEDESCGESIFISPATPVDEQPIRNPLSPSHRGLSVSSYAATSISDSDVDSFRDKQLGTSRDGEALLFRDEGFGDNGKSLPGLFNDPDHLSTPKWPDMPMSQTDASEMGDDEASVVGMPLALQKLRPCPSRPLTQRERLRALGYDYDSDSDTETPARTDELPEERALELISSLMKGTASLEGGQHVDEKTIVKLRKDIKRRRMLDARKGSKFHSKENSGMEATALGITVTE